MVSRRAVLLVLAAAAAALGVVVARRLAREPPTDEEAIRALFEEAAKAAEQRRPGQAVEGVSDRFRGHGLDRDGVRRLVAFEVLRGEWLSVTIAQARIAVDGDRARANVDAILARGSGKGKALEALLPGEASAHRFRCRLEREKDGWRVVEAEWRGIGLPDAIAGPPEP
jgi:hypothetical protein